jgi:DNA polymerase-3 subunit alpha
MKANGFNEASIAALWDVLVPFSDYAFNKAHTAAYGLVSYWTAYLKANYPAEYMAALLTSVGDDKDKSALYLNECRHMGIKVLPPDVNDSSGQFAAVGADIRFGLAGDPQRRPQRRRGDHRRTSGEGAFTSFEDFLSQGAGGGVQQAHHRVAHQGGAFDGLGEPRMGLLQVHEEYVDAFVAVKRQEAIGQDSLFGSFGDDSGGDSGGDLMGLASVPAVEWDKSALLSFEREMLGLYVSDHPLFGVEHVLSQHADTSDRGVDC